MTLKPLLPHLILGLLSTLLISCHSAKDKAASAENNSHPQIKDALVDDENTDWKKDHLSGHVKSVRQVDTFIYKKREPKVSITKVDFTPFGKWKYQDYAGQVWKYKYNANGQVTEIKEYMSGNPISKVIYSYADDGNLLNRQRYETRFFSSTEEWEAHKANMPNLPHEGLFLKANRVYHDNGNETSTIFKENSDIEYILNEVHDEKSRIVEFTETDPSSKELNYKHIRSWDENDNYVEYKAYEGPENTLTEVVNKKYDENNRIIQQTALRYKPEPVSKTEENNTPNHLNQEGHIDEERSYSITYTYDSHGNFTSETIKKHTGELLREKTIERSYDDHQNVTQEVVVNSDGNNLTNSFKYDENGNEIYYKSETAKGEILETITRKFDDQNNLIDYKLENHQKQQLEIETKVFDEVGNWIKWEQKVLDSKTNELQESTTKQREIIYY